MGKESRDLEIKRRFHCGLATMQMLADEYSVTRQRIQQIVRNPLHVKKTPLSETERRDKAIRRNTNWNLKGLRGWLRYCSKGKMQLVRSKGCVLRIRSDDGRCYDVLFHEQDLYNADVEYLVPLICNGIYRAELKAQTEE